MQRYMKKIFRSRREFTEHLRMIRHFIAFHTETEPFPLLLAIDEAVNNALVHGNGNDTSKKVVFQMHCRGTCLLVRVEDEGKKLTRKLFYRHLNSPGRNNLLEEHGRGMFLIEKCSRDLSFPEPGTICMTFPLGTPSGEKNSDSTEKRKDDPL